MLIVFYFTSSVNLRSQLPVPLHPTTQLPAPLQPAPSPQAHLSLHMSPVPAAPQWATSPPNTSLVSAQILWPEFGYNFPCIFRCEGSIHLHSLYSCFIVCFWILPLTTQCNRIRIWPVCIQRIRISLPGTKHSRDPRWRTWLNAPGDDGLTPGYQLQRLAA